MPEFIRFFTQKQAETDDQYNRTLVRSLNALGVRLQKVNTVIDVTSETSDYSLSVNETAKITISAASTPLNIATMDGKYSISMDFDISTFASDQTLLFQVNNTDYTNEFLITRLNASTALATDEVDTADVTANNHRFTPGTFSPYRIDCELVIRGNQSSLMSYAYGTNSTNRFISFTGSVRNASPAHTSLGTLNLGEACTGVLYVKRQA
jgi:hypothetical protein